MKNILIVIHGMKCGGAERSLISFLKALPNDKWNIDLLVASPRGVLMNDIPEYVNVITDLHDLENYAAPLEERRKKVCSVRDFFCQVKWQVQSRINKFPELMFDEKRWKLWGRYLPKLGKKYDLAVSYLNGLSSYYVIDKVNAEKKILWVHNEFEKLEYNYEFEYPFYKKADCVVTISQSCVESFLRVYPEFKDKTVVLENISSEKTIKALANESIDDSYFSDNRIKLLSVGRLFEQKGFDLAVEAAKQLKDKNLNFIWYILGEGYLRSQLQKTVDEFGLSDCFKLVGFKPNPYPYISSCDIFVQTSRFEGKSVVLDEAKILCKPIVVTNYGTVENSICNNVNGVIAEFDPEAVAESIYNLATDDRERSRLTERLRCENNGNEDEIDKYIALFGKYLL